MCDNFKCYSLIVVPACSIVVHKWVWMLDISPLFLSFFQRSLFLFLIFLDIIFTLVLLLLLLLLFFTGLQQNVFT